MKCGFCEHDLTGLPEGVCPVCGTAFTSPPPEPRYGRCRTCDYDLTGLSESRCPECGTPFTRAIADNRFTLCPECFYDLVGNTTGRCPECGTDYTPDGVDEFWESHTIATDTLIVHLFAPGAICWLAALAAVLLGDIAGPAVLVLAAVSAFVYAVFTSDRLARRIAYTRIIRHPHQRAARNPKGVATHLLAIGLLVVRLFIMAAGCCFCSALGPGR